MIYEKYKTFLLVINSCFCNIGVNKGSFNRYYNAGNVCWLSNYNVYNIKRI